jgi:hypothetical protein
MVPFENFWAATIAFVELPMNKDDFQETLGPKTTDVVTDVLVEISRTVKSRILLEFNGCSRTVRSVAFPTYGKSSMKGGSPGE